MQLFESDVAEASALQEEINFLEGMSYSAILKCGVKRTSKNKINEPI